jgi:hypothetical protein
MEEYSYTCTHLLGHNRACNGNNLFFFTYGIRSWVGLLLDLKVSESSCSYRESNYKLSDVHHSPFSTPTASCRLPAGFRVGICIVGGNYAMFVTQHVKMSYILHQNRLVVFIFVSWYSNSSRGVQIRLRGIQIRLACKVNSLRLSCG